MLLSILGAAAQEESSQSRKISNGVTDTGWKSETSQRTLLPSDIPIRAKPWFLIQMKSLLLNISSIAIFSGKSLSEIAKRTESEWEIYSFRKPFWMESHINPIYTYQWEICRRFIGSKSTSLLTNCRWKRFAMLVSFQSTILEILIQLSYLGKFSKLYKYCFNRRPSQSQMQAAIRLAKLWNAGMRIDLPSPYSERTCSVVLLQTLAG